MFATFGSNILCYLMGHPQHLPQEGNDSVVCLHFCVFFFFLLLISVTSETFRVG